MTICIAALSENGKKIIIASDTMITVGRIIEFEHNVPKFVKLTDNCLVMSAGSATLQDDVVKHVLSEIGLLNNPNVDQISDKLKDAYKTIRTRRAEEIHLLPMGLDYKNFYINQRSLLPEVVFQLTDSIKNSNLGVEFILCGFDDNGGHIHLIRDPGTSECFDSVGFCAIGTGFVNAVSKFTAHRYAPNFTIEKSLYLMYLAKREAERAPGVGKDTDMAIISEDGIETLKNNEVEELDRIYTKNIKIEEEEYKEVRNIIFEKREEKNANHE